MGLGGPIIPSPFSGDSAKHSSNDGVVDAALQYPLPNLNGGGRSGTRPADFIGIDVVVKPFALDRVGRKGAGRLRSGALNSSKGDSGMMLGDESINPGSGVGSGVGDWMVKKAGL